MSDAPPQGTWAVTRYRRGDDLIDLPTGAHEATLTIDGSRLSGKMGVNLFVGRLQDGRPIGPFAVTRMSGSPEAMRQEDILLRLLEAVDHIEADESGMKMSSEGLTTLEFHRAEPNGGRASS